MKKYQYNFQPGFALLGLIIALGVLAVLVMTSFYAGKISENKSIISVGQKAIDQIKGLPLSRSDDGQSSGAEESNGVRLDLSNQGLNTLPAYVLGMKQLEILDLSNNNLTGALPGEIRSLQNLKELKLSHNAMTGIPAEVGQLSRLEILDYSYNQITGIPNEIANLKNLKTLNLTGNNFSRQDLAGIVKQLPNLQVIY
ncbi:MAG: leucine-rich repeat domain-containing protein [Patescibacteria group bacterium]